MNKTQEAIEPARETTPARRLPAYAFFAGSAISAFFGSAIIDRLGYKHTSVIGDIASGIRHIRHIYTSVPLY